MCLLIIEVFLKYFKKRELPTIQKKENITSYEEFIINVPFPSLSGLLG